VLSLLLLHSGGYLNHGSEGLDLCLTHDPHDHAQYEAVVPAVLNLWVLMSDS
jgi:hypothetical protein